MLYASHPRTPGRLNVFDLTSKWSGFAKADVRFGDNMIGTSSKIGLRYQW